MNRILANMPGWVLYFLYQWKLKKAKVDRDKIAQSWSNYLKQEVRRVLQLPSLRATKSPLVTMMVGLPFTGKTTVADMIAEFNFFRINTNQIRGWLTDAGCSYAHDSIIALCYMEQVLALGYDVVCDSDHMLPVKRAFVKAVAKHANKSVRFELVNLGTQLSHLKSRLLAISDTKKFHRLYGDAINCDGKQVTVKELRELVLKEYERQAPGHREYGHLISGRKGYHFIHLSDSIKNLEDSARSVGQKIVAK